MRVIGTAGHVDHGKSTLVEALTGIHPDRLKEEREREMTIDLGFAWMTLDRASGGSSGEPGGGEEVGIIDVPGHRDFIENMLAGIGGIDAALFVVAADEGIMPQTREHLSILDILQIQGGVVALTKIDLIEDSDLSRSDWLDLVEADLSQILKGSVLENSPIVRVSARTGEGIPELKSALSACLAERPPRLDLNRPRLPIDRVFTMPGFGSIVTGTLMDGKLQVGDEVEILPQGLRGRVRGLQTHKQKETVAVPGSRTAVNISGVSLDQLKRGDVVTHPGNYLTTRRLDVRFRLLPDVSQPLEHNTEVKLFIGTTEAVARVRLLGSEKLDPGEQGWLQLELLQPIVATRGDHYILRRPSPGETLGGGVVIDPQPKKRHKRFAEETRTSLESLSRGTPSDVLQQTLMSLGAAALKNVVARSNLDAATATQAVSELVDSGQLINLEAEATLAATDYSPDALVVGHNFWQQVAHRMIQETESYHKNYPLRRGIPREELKSRLNDLSKFSPRLFNLSLNRLIAQGELVEAGLLIACPGHTVRFTTQQQQNIDRLLAQFKASPYSPPTLKDCHTQVGEEVITALIELGQLAAVAPDVIFRKEDYQRMVEDVRTLVSQQGEITVAQVRDHFNTSRRYVLAFLEHLDAIGVTVRDGDVRRLKG
jgi:selenocysteine-specific elongation factor